MLKAGRYSLLLCCLLTAVFFGNTVWIVAKAQLAQVLIERAWAVTLDTGNASPPWPWADFWPVARMSVRQSGEVLYVLSSASGESLSFGPGHMHGSALPATTGTSIIAAHRDTHFKFLKDIQKGEAINIQRPDGLTSNYQVSGIEIVDIRDTSLTVVPGREELKLVTCYPFEAVLPGGPKRLVVQLLRVGGLLQG